MNGPLGFEYSVIKPIHLAAVQELAEVSGTLMYHDFSLHLTFLIDAILLVFATTKNHQGLLGNSVGNIIALLSCMFGFMQSH